MSVKAREEVKSRQFSTVGMLLIGVFVVAYIFIYNRSISNMDNYALKTGIGIAALIVMAVFFFVVLRFIHTTFYLLLTHQSLNIERKMLFTKKEVADIQVKDIVAVVPEENYKGNVPIKKYTLARIENKAVYAITYKEGGKVCCAKIQCSAKFFKTLKGLVKA